MSDVLLESAEATKEAAKATGEVAKLGARVLETLDPALRPMAQLVGSILAIPADGVGFVADYVHAQRTLNAERLNEKVAAARAARGGISAGSAPPLAFALPLLEQATLVDDEELQSWWANLIVSTVQFHVEPRKAYVDILSSMTALDAQCLARIVDHNRRGFDDPRIRYNWVREGVERDVAHKNGTLSERGPHRMSDDQYILSIENFIRLRCVVEELIVEGRTAERMLSPTELGKALVEACTPPNPNL